MIFRHVKIPQHRTIIKVNERGRNKKMIIIGGDTETFKGEPFSFQFYSEDIEIENITFTNGKDSFRSFISFLNTLPNDGSSYVIYFHNLTYDIVSLFYSRKETLLDETGEFKYGKWKIKFLFGDTVYVTLTHSSKRKTVYLVDSARFLMASLSKLADTFFPDLPKLDPPKGLGQKKFGPNNKKFISYSMQDAKIVYHLGKLIDGVHLSHDVRQSVSIAQLASRIFRHAYMKNDIPLPMRKIVYASLHSYHGGKNLFIGKPGLYKNINCVDIISAYPYAMSLLPSFSKPELYKGWKSWDDTPVPELGIYKVTGYVHPCDYPIIYDHGFQKMSGKFTAWITGFELNEAMEKEEIEIEEVFGYFYDGDGDNVPSPFKEFVDYFFEAKETAADPVTRHFNKIILNSLYGKFIQKNYRKNCFEFIFDVDTEKLIEVQPDFEAGGMFHPFIASLITGHTRTYIHRLEHQFKAIHTSTDGIVTKRKPKEIPGLGGYKIEFSGDMLILRNKLYIGYNNEPNDRPSVIYPGKYIHKYALHGFRGSVETLERIVKDNVRKYKYIKVNKLRESHKRGLNVNAFEEREATIKIGEINI
jgi:hypothetical protein